MLKISKHYICLMTQRKIFKKMGHFFPEIFPQCHVIKCKVEKFQIFTQL